MAGIATNNAVVRVAELETLQPKMLVSQIADGHPRHLEQDLPYPR